VVQEKRSVLKNDRWTYSKPRLPSGGTPLARGDTDCRGLPAVFLAGNSPPIRWIRHLERAVHNVVGPECFNRESWKMTSGISLNIGETS